MSLINQMLNDLESRSDPGSAADGMIAGSSASPSRRGLPPLTIILTAIIILLALGLAYSLWWPQQELSNSKVQLDSATATTIPVTTAAPKTTVIVTPVIQPGTAVVTPHQPTLVKKAKASPVRATASINSRLSRVTPSVIDGSWQLRTLTLKGEQLNPDHRVEVRWGDKRKILSHERIEWVDTTSVRIKLITGNADELWQLSLIRPDGSRSNSVEFEVIATPSAEQPETQSRVDSRDGRMKKTIHPPSKNEKADQLYQQGYRTLQQGKTDSTDKLWQQALSILPAHITSREGLVALYLSQGRKIEASVLLETGVALHPDNANFAMLHARLLTEQGDTSRAIATLERVMDRARQQPEIFALAAALYQQQSEFGKSINAYRHALQLQPQQSHWWMGLGISMEGAEKQAEAVSAYQEALQRGGLGKESRNYTVQRIDELK